MSPMRRCILAASALLASGFHNRAVGLEKKRDNSKGKTMTGKNVIGSSGYADVDGLRVYYELHGARLASDTVPLVLLPGGAMTVELAFGETLLPRFARTRPVIAIEPQGHGHTGDRPGPITVPRMVDDLAGVLAHLGVKRADFVGHSLGGIIALGTAIHHPGLVRSLTLLGAFYQLDGMLPDLVKMHRDPAHQPAPEVAALLPTEADFAAMRASFSKHAPRPDAFDAILERLNIMLTEWPGYTPAQLRALRSASLIVIGDNDFVRVDHAAEMARLIPGAELAVLPGTTHLSIAQRGQWLELLMEDRLKRL